MPSQKCSLWKVISTSISMMFCLVRIWVHLWLFTYVWGSGQRESALVNGDQRSVLDLLCLDMVLHWTMSIACHLPAGHQAPRICLTLPWSSIKCESFRIWHHFVHLTKLCYIPSPKSVLHKGRGNPNSTLRNLLQDAFPQN